jgi:vitamin-K-epoxide reductase (warfarin-sensitive)
MSAAMNTAAARLLLVIAVLALAGMAVSSVSLAHHYSTSKSSFCDFSETVNCDIVNRSEYSTLLGVPVALMGVLGYFALLVIAMMNRRRSGNLHLLFWLAVAGLAFALYLTYIEGFVLYTWCILCLSSLSIIFSITVISFLTLRLARRQSAS